MHGRRKIGLEGDRNLPGLGVEILVRDKRKPLFAAAIIQANRLSAVLSDKGRVRISILIFTVFLWAYRRFTRIKFNYAAIVSYSRNCGAQTTE